MRWVTAGRFPFATPQVLAVSYETHAVAIGENFVKRVIKSHGLWLTLGYLSVLLLIAKAYA